MTTNNTSTSPTSVPSPASLSGAEQASSSAKSSGTTSASRKAWRPLDVVIASILGIAAGFVFTLWNGPGYVLWEILEGVSPGIAGLVTGIWFIGGPLGALIIRKPGAAIYVETLAATTSMILGSQWGISAVYSGLMQGLGAELVFILFLYRKHTLPVAMLSGLGAGLGAWCLELVTSGNIAKGPEFLIIYASCVAISGAVLAGLPSYLLTEALAKAGVLGRFGR